MWHVVRLFGGVGVALALLAAGCRRGGAGQGGTNSAGESGLVGGASATGFAQVIGGPGHTGGRFNRPRGIEWDEGRGVLFVVDWDGRIQKFGAGGEFRGSWIMPEVEQGKPEGLCLTAAGTVWVTDTHYSRMVEFAVDGRELRRFGSYGRGPGQFIYPVAVAVDRAGHLYVAEYGENDRVQVFGPDGEFRRQFGSFGTAPGQFQRPSGLAISAADELYVADAVNHRVQVFSLAGELRRTIGRPGRGPGEFNYPYDVSIQGAELYVIEYGNQRVQRLTLAGEPRGSFGRPGRGDGEFAGPWKLCATPAGVLVSDTNNNRVVRVRF